jgi:hypothetical protein
MTGEATPPLPPATLTYIPRLVEDTRQTGAQMASPPPPRCDGSTDRPVIVLTTFQADDLVMMH